MKRHPISTLAPVLLLAGLLPVTSAHAQPAPPPVAPPPVAPPPVAPPPAVAPAQLPAPPPAQPAPFAAAAPPFAAQPIGPMGPPGAPGYGEDLVVMPPGFAESPGLFPRVKEMKSRRAPPPPGYHPGKEARRPLWISGTAIFAASHAVTGLTAGALWAGSGDETYGLLYIPILGPVIWSPVAFGLGSDDDRAMFAGMSLITAVQGVGFGLLLAGVVFPKNVYLRNDVGELAPSIHLTDHPGGLGLSVDF